MIVVDAENNVQRMLQGAQGRIEIGVAAFLHVLGKKGNERKIGYIVRRGAFGQAVVIVARGDEQRPGGEQFLQFAVRRVGGHARKSEIHP